MGMEPKEIPELLDSDRTVQKQQWQLSKDVEDQVLLLIQSTGVLPTTMRASPSRLEEFYHHGFMLYKFGRYKEAQPYFHLLSLADPKNTKYIMALAACFHMQKHYTSAIQMYSSIMYFDPDNPLPLYHAADCYIKMMEPFNALIFLELAIQKCRDPKHQALKDRMTMMVTRLGNELKAKMKESQESFIGQSGRKLILCNGKVFLDKQGVLD